jgi:hypothetical protein
METQFTKGDWITGDRFKNIVGVNESEPLLICDCSIDKDICKQEQIANAKLITAAPDLFEIAKRCLQWCNGVQNTKFINKLRIDTENAIKKATE